MKLQFDGFDSKGRIKIRYILDEPLENYTAIQTDFRIAFPEYAPDIDQIGDTLYLPSMLFLRKELFSIFVKRSVLQQEYAVFINKLIEKGIPVKKNALLEQKEFESKEQQNELSIKFDDEAHLAYMGLLRMLRQMELSEDEIAEMQELYNANKVDDLSNSETSYCLGELVATNNDRLIASIHKISENDEYFLFLYDQNGNILKARYSNAPHKITQIGEQFLMTNGHCQIQYMDSELNVVSQNHSPFYFRDIKNLNDHLLCIDSSLNWKALNLFVVPREHFNHLLQNNVGAVERFVVPVPTSYSALIGRNSFVIPKPNMIVRLVQGDKSNHLAFIQFKPKNINCISMLPEGNSVPDHIDEHVIVLQKTDDFYTAFWQDEKQICHGTLNLINAPDMVPDHNNEIRDPDFVRFIVSRCTHMFQVQRIVPLTKPYKINTIHDLKNGTFAVVYEGGDHSDIEVEIRDGSTGKLIDCHKIKDFAQKIGNIEFISEKNTLFFMASTEGKNEDADIQVEDEKTQPSDLTDFRKNIAFLDLASGQISRRIAHTEYGTYNNFCVLNGKVVMPARLEIAEDKFDNYCIHFMDPEYTRRYHAAVRKEILESIHEAPTGLDPDTMELVADFVGTDDLNYPDRARIRQSVRSWPAVNFMANRVQQSGDAEDEQADEAISTAAVVPSRLQIA